MPVVRRIHSLEVCVNVLLVGSADLLVKIKVTLHW